MAGMFYIGGCLDASTIVHPIHSYTPICLYAPRGVHAPICPHTLLCLCVILEALHVVGGCNGLPFVLGYPPLHHPCLGVLPLNYTPHTQSLVPCALVCFRDISMLCGHFPYVEGFGGFPHQLGGWEHQHLRCPYAHSCTFFVVLYVSCFNYSSNYYSSSYCGIFWSVFHVISDRQGSFPDRVSSKLGSTWHGSTTTLDAERLWRCSWLSFCATAVTSIFNASFSLCQLCYGFFTGKFLFQS